MRYWPRMMWVRRWWRVQRWCFQRLKGGERLGWICGRLGWTVVGWICKSMERGRWCNEKNNEMVK